MTVIPRAIWNEAMVMAGQLRGLCITGPRQSGKSTLAKMVFASKPYISFENPRVEAEAQQDLKGYVKQLDKGAILDEVQRLQDIFRCLQQIFDDDNTRGRFILTGSNNFLLHGQIPQ